jgi:hypothetical protein
LKHKQNSTDNGRQKQDIFLRADPKYKLQGLEDNLLSGHFGDDGVRSLVKVLNKPLMISRSLALWEADKEAKVVARPDLGCSQGNGRPSMNAVLHHTLDPLRNVKEARLETLTLGAHVDHGGVRSLVERLQLRLQF